MGLFGNGNEQGSEAAPQGCSTLSLSPLESEAIGMMSQLQNDSSCLIPSFSQASMDANAEKFFSQDIPAYDFGKAAAAPMAIAFKDSALAPNPEVVSQTNQKFFNEMAA
ncbi:MAG: hypothetical protein IPG59_11415 [Candidatus Melainabacteria bacterium]|nr:MAG: hypothetical protein IPG59_11415 [Candidatus Melainabacteria bacterium]